MPIFITLGGGGGGYGADEADVVCVFG